MFVAACLLLLTARASSVVSVSSGRNAKSYIESYLSETFKSEDLRDENAKSVFALPEGRNSPKIGVNSHVQSFLKKSFHFSDLERSGKSDPSSSNKVPFVSPTLTAVPTNYFVTIYFTSEQCFSNVDESASFGLGVCILFQPGVSSVALTSTGVVSNGVFEVIATVYSSIDCSGSVLAQQSQFFPKVCTDDGMGGSNLFMYTSSPPVFPNPGLDFDAYSTQSQCLSQQGVGVRIWSRTGDCTPYGTATGEAARLTCYQGAVSQKYYYDLYCANMEYETRIPPQTCTYDADQGLYVASTCTGDASTNIAPYLVANYFQVTDPPKNDCSNPIQTAVAVATEVCFIWYGGAWTVWSTDGKLVNGVLTVYVNVFQNAGCGGDSTSTAMTFSTGCQGTLYSLSSSAPPFNTPGYYDQGFASTATCNSKSSIYVSRWFQTNACEPSGATSQQLSCSNGAVTTTNYKDPNCGVFAYSTVDSAKTCALQTSGYETTSCTASW